MLKYAVMLGLGAIAGGFLGVGQASAALLSQEQFSYTAGSSVSGQNGGTGWSSDETRVDRPRGVWRACRQPSSVQLGWPRSERTCRVVGSGFWWVS